MTSIPDHCVSDCPNIEARMKDFDVLNENNVLRGDPEEVKLRLSKYRDGAMLAREYDYYKQGRCCCTCFWRMVFERLPSTVRGFESEMKSIYYTEIACNKDELEEEHSLNRMVKQQTEPFLKYAYIVEHGDEGGRRDCVVKLIYKTQSENKPKTQVFERIFPEGSVVRNKLQISNSVIVSIIGNPDVVMHGNWD